MIGARRAVEGGRGRVRLAGVALLAAGLVAVWATGAMAAVKPADPSGIPAFGEVYRVHEARANSFTASAQDNVAMDFTRDGGCVVAWDSRRQQGGTYGVYLQRFDAAGQPIGTETQVNVYTRNMQMQPSVAADGQGGIWVAWESFGQDGSMNGVIARRFNADLTGGSDEILVNEQTLGPQGDVVVATDSAGRALFAWTTACQDLARPQVKARCFDRDGQPLTDEFVVSARMQGGAQHLPAVSVDGQGRAIIAWAEEAGQDRSSVYARMFAFDGRPLSGNLSVASSAIEPAVAAAADGSFAVAWLSPVDEDYSVWTRKFDRTGRPQGEARQVSNGQGRYINGAAVASAADGRFVVSYNAFGPDGHRNGIFARFFNADGRPCGGCERVNLHTRGNQRLAAASGKQRADWAADGRIAFAWSGNSGQEDKHAASVTLLVPRDQTCRLASAARVDLPDDAVELAARPHVPPRFDPAAVSHLPNGGDSQPFPLDGDVGFIGIESTGWNPPDPHLAVGPEHVVVIVNGGIAFYTKDGTQTFYDEIEDSFGFWGEVGASDFIFDPEVLYDGLSGRFWAMAAEGYAPGGKSYCLVAVSDDSDPNGTWYKYRFDTTQYAGNLFDSPNIGVSDDVLLITGDGFGYGAVYPVYTYDKASLLVGDPPAVTQSTTLSTSTQSAGYPAVSYDDPPYIYLIEHAEGYGETTVRLLAVLDPLTDLDFATYTLTVPSYSNPENPPQKGTGVRPTSFDSRFWSVDYRNGSLWAVHHVDNNRVRARWYEIAMNNWPDSGQNPELVQWGEIDPGGSVRTFFPSIAADGAGNAFITTARSSFDEYISMSWTYRLPSDPLGDFQPLEFVKVSAGPYTSNRWGDYSGTRPDPAAPGTFWGHHEYSPGSGTWNTWVGAKTLLPEGTVLASDFTIVRGELLGGGLSDLVSSDDSRLDVKVGFVLSSAEPPVWIVLDATAATASPSEFRFDLEAKVNAGGLTQKIELYNFDTEEWELVDTRPATVSDSSVEIVASGDLTRFIEPGTLAVKAQLTWKAFGPITLFPWQVGIDKAGWMIK